MLRKTPNRGVTIATAKVNPFEFTSSYLTTFPTTRMCEQFVDELKALGLDESRIIHIDSKTSPNDVVPKLTKVVKCQGGMGLVVVCCHESFLRLPFFPRSGWKVFIDEIPPVERTYSPRLPESGIELGEWLKIEDGDCEFARVVPRNETQLRHRLEALTDDWKKDQKAVLRTVLNPFMTVYVDRQMWNKLVERGEVPKKDKKDKTKNRLTFIYVIKPEKLNGFAFLGANFVSSTTYEWLELNGVKLVPHKELDERLRCKQHPRRDIEICYAVNKKRFSKDLRNKDEFAFLRVYEPAVLSKLESENAHQFLLHGNVDYTEGTARDEKTGAEYKSALPRDSRCITLPATAHGLNHDEFQRCTIVVTLGAFNRNPKVERFMRDLGISQKALNDTYYEQVYQGVCRCNIRIVGEDESGNLQTPNEKITIIVPDKGVADYLAARLTGAQVTRLKGDFKQFEAVPGKDRTRKWREKKKKGHLTQVIAEVGDKGGVCDESLRVFSTENVTPLQPTQKDFHPADFITAPRDHNVVVTLLDYKEKKNAGSTHTRPFSLLVSDFEARSHLPKKVR